MENSTHVLGFHLEKLFPVPLMLHIPQICKTVPFNLYVCGRCKSSCEVYLEELLVMCSYSIEMASELGLANL